MIELRWTWKEQETGIIAGEVSLNRNPTFYPVLQYREANPHPVDGHIVGEWIDVPLPPKP